MRSPEQRRAIRQALVEAERDDIEREHLGLPGERVPHFHYQGPPALRGRPCYRSDCPAAEVLDGSILPHHAPRTVFSFSGDQTEHQAHPARSAPTSLAAEPPFPGQETVVFSFRSPDLTCHMARPECSVAEPHPIADCPLWSPGS